MQEYPGRYIAMMHRKSQIFWNQQLKSCGITAAEVPVLFHLYQEQGVTQEDIAGSLGVDKSTMTRAIQSLMEKGLIERKKDEKDHRCNRIFLTENGQKIYEPVNQARRKWNEKLLNQMNEQEQDEFMRLLSIAASNIKL